MAIITTNPTTGEILRVFTKLTDDEVKTKIACADGAFRTWRNTSLSRRASVLAHAATILERDKQRFAELMTLEMGKPVRAASDEAVKCATACKYYAENGARLLADREITSQSFVRYRPIGPVLAIMPWNFPFWQVFRFAAPALMAGNVGLLKHASNVPQCALAIGEIFREAGAPDGVFQTLLIESDQVSSVLEDDRIAAATLTGSEGAGRSVASAAGKVIKKTVLELGGSDPFIVMPSADLDETVITAVRARTINNGQSCIAAKRFIIHDSVYEEFAKRFTERMAALTVGDPMEPAADVGPLATAQIVKDLHDQVQRAAADGARVRTGGNRVARAGFFYQPTVLENIPRSSAVYREELFGPVAMLFRVRDLDEAIELANDSPFGLGASAWTRDEAERERFVNEIESGMVFINAMVASDARLPFGGVKRSGYGRELGEYGIHEFVNIKTVYIK
jgi:succinate-semialdehyde dehydrogenase/glutarate-semialdehyde dehydrogenase